MLGAQLPALEESLHDAYDEAPPFPSLLGSVVRSVCTGTMDLPFKRTSTLRRLLGELGESTILDLLHNGCSFAYVFIGTLPSPRTNATATLVKCVMTSRVSTPFQDAAQRLFYCRRCLTCLRFGSTCPNSERSIGAGSLGGICPARLISTICVF